MITTITRGLSIALIASGVVVSDSAAAKERGEVTSRERMALLADPIINLGHPIPSVEALASGHPHEDGYQNGGMVHCVASPASLSGTNPKFNCFLAAPSQRSYLQSDGSLLVEELGDAEVVHGDFYDERGVLHTNVLLDLDRGRFLDTSGRPRTDIDPKQIKVKYNDNSTLLLDPRWSDAELGRRVASEAKPPLRKARDPYTEVAATSLFWALGYPVDRSDSTKAVVCYGCDGDNLIAIDAMIDNYYPGVRIFSAGSDPEQGWSTKELRTGPYRSWSLEQKMYFDGLVLLATLIHHKSNRSHQNNLLCSAWDGSSCVSRPTILIHDLGSVFGAPSAKGRIEAWKSRDVWQNSDDPMDCSVGLNWKDGGGHVEVSDAGRRFIIEKFGALTDAHLYAIFSSAHFERVDGQLRLKTLQKIFPATLWKRESSAVQRYLDKVYTGGSGDDKLTRIFAVLARLESRMSPLQLDKLDRAVIETWMSVLRSKVGELETKRCRL